MSVCRTTGPQVWLTLLLTTSASSCLKSSHNLGPTFSCQALYAHLGTSQRYLTAEETLTTSDGKVDNNPEEGPLSISMTPSTATLEVKLTGDFMSLVTDANVFLSCKDSNFTGVSVDNKGDTFVFENVIPKTGEECNLAVSEVG